MKFIKAKTILTLNKDKESFGGVDYNINLYRGCNHNCIYCYSRSGNYYKDDFEEIEIKENALKLLDKELSNLDKTAFICTGSMNDPYMQIEKELDITGRALEIIKKHKGGVLVITKSNLITKDIERLKLINHAVCAFSITTFNDELAAKIEPNAPLPSKRFEAMKKLSENGIYTGTFMMPILPFIEDNFENIKAILDKTKENGGSFVLPWLAVSLRDRQKEYYYQKLDLLFPNLRKRYENTYRQITCNSLKSKELYHQIASHCQKIGLSLGVGKKFINESKQLNFNF